MDTEGAGRVSARWGGHFCPPRRHSCRWGRRFACPRTAKRDAASALSLRTGHRIDWDAANLKAKGLPEADAVIKESYRSGWEVA